MKTQSWLKVFMRLFYEGVAQNFKSKSSSIRWPPKKLKIGMNTPLT